MKTSSLLAGDRLLRIAITIGLAVAGAAEAQIPTRPIPSTSLRIRDAGLGLKADLSFSNVGGERRLFLSVYDPASGLTVSVTADPTYRALDIYPNTSANEPIVSYSTVFHLTLQDAGPLNRGILLASRGDEWLKYYVERLPFRGVLDGLVNTNKSIADKVSSIVPVEHLRLVDSKGTRVVGFGSSNGNHTSVVLFGGDDRPIGVWETAAEFMEISLLDRLGDIWVSVLFRSGQPPVLTGYAPKGESPRFWTLYSNTGAKIPLQGSAGNLRWVPSGSWRSRPPLIVSDGSNNLVWRAP